MEELMMELETVVLEMEDGTSLDFAIVDEFELEGKQYAFLIQVEGDELLDDEDHSIIMNIEKDDTCDDDEIILNNIESDEEYCKVVAYFTSLLEAEEEELED